MTGYPNVIARYQHPKPNHPAEDPWREIGPKLYEARNSRYRWNQGLNVGLGKTDGAGEYDERVAWRCSCGAEIDCDREACSRCGSTEPGEFR